MLQNRRAVKRLSQMIENSLKFSSTCVEDTMRLGRALGEILTPGDVVLLDGDLGAGKTQLAQSIAAGLGVQDEIVSPTFNIVFEYSADGAFLYHFDLYRLDAPDELDDIDFFALTDEDADGISLIEWASKFPDEMPDDRLEILIEKPEDASCARSICVSAQGQRAEAVLSKLAERL